MQLDVTELRDFYATPLGQATRRVLAHRIRARWRSAGGLTMLGLGYACPYLGAFRGEALRLGALMPAAQGALVWPPTGRTLSVLVEEDQLPLPDNAVDRLLAVHCLEMAERVGPLLREMWRVLAPDGRLLMVVPNRRGVWARLDRTPFGHGRPYSRGQLETILKGALFTPLEWGTALHMPPFDRRMPLRSSIWWERLGARISPAFAGVIIVEARKELVAPIGKRARTRSLRQLVPVRGSPLTPKQACMHPRDETARGTAVLTCAASAGAGTPPSRRAGSAARASSGSAAACRSC
jgi:SAM-dependent methyltransferase